MTIPASQLLHELRLVTPADLTTMDGIGDILAQNIVEFAQSVQATQLADKLALVEQSAKGIELEETPAIVQDGTRKTVCITGSFDISRDEIAVLLEKNGYKIVSAVSKKTDILLAGEAAGSKQARAEALGVPIVTDYLELL
jgi:DNA ligase (NAD+)